MIASSSTVAAVPSTSSSLFSSSSNRLHRFILRGAAAPLSSVQSAISSTMPSELNDQNKEKTGKVQPMARNHRSESDSRCVACGHNETRAFVDPADFFARQSLNASRIARRTNTRQRFQQQNALFEDLLLAEAERDAVPTTLTIRGTETAGHANADG